MPIDRLMDKEDVVHIYNGLLLSHKKERNWVICRDVDGPRDCHTEWSKSEREKQGSYINTHMWNIEKWYRWTSLEGRNRDTDVENKRVDTKGRKWRGGGGGGGMNWGIGIDMYTQICIKYITWASLVAQWLRICLPMQGTQVRALVWEDPTCRGATKPVSHSYWACASGACAPQ